MNRDRAKALAKLCGWRDTPLVRDAFCLFDLHEFARLVEAEATGKPLESIEILRMAYPTRYGSLGCGEAQAAIAFGRAIELAHGIDKWRKPANRI
jgi:hypothetical protein